MKCTLHCLKFSSVNLPHFLVFVLLLFLIIKVILVDGLVTQPTRNDYLFKAQILAMSFLMMMIQLFIRFILHSIVGVTTLFNHFIATFVIIMCPSKCRWSIAMPANSYQTNLYPMLFHRVGSFFVLK
jgi:hypothetical protein